MLPQTASEPEPGRHRSEGFPCPKCGTQTLVIEARSRESGFIFRRRRCPEKTCGKRISTHELMCFET